MDILIYELLASKFERTLELYEILPAKHFPKCPYKFEKVLNVTENNGQTYIPQGYDIVYITGGNTVPNVRIEKTAHGNQPEIKIIDCRTKEKYSLIYYTLFDGYICDINYGLRSELIFNEPTRSRHNHMEL